MCGAIDLRELAPPSVGKGAADRVVTLRREAAAFLPAASFELRAPDCATACAWAEVLAARRAKQLSAAACDAPAGFDGSGSGNGSGSGSGSGSLSPARTGEDGSEHLLGGYLAKRGGFVASWKRRWFVMRRVGYRAAGSGSSGCLLRLRWAGMRARHGCCSRQAPTPTGCPRRRAPCRAAAPLRRAATAASPPLR
jgi:hypothetical protein